MQGDEVELYERYAVMLERMLIRELRAPRPVIEDACQHAWAQFLTHSDDIEHSRALSWLAVTATRRARRLARREARELSLEVEIEQGREPADTVWGVDPAFVVEQRAELARLEALPERQRRVVVLKGAGLTYEEIAVRTGDSVRTVERQLLKARNALEREPSGPDAAGDETQLSSRRPRAFTRAPADQSLVPKPGI